MNTLTGEDDTLTARWTKCRVCGQATSQPPVCWDLRCEIAYEDREPDSNL